MSGPPPRIGPIRSALLSALALALLIGCGKPGDEHADHDDDHAPTVAGEATHVGDIHLDPAGLRRARIEVGAVAARVLGGGVRIPAEIQLVPQRTAHVAPLSPGRLVRVDAEPGQAVKAGDVLAVVSSSEVASLSAKSEQLRAQLQAARATLERQKQLAGDGITSQRVVIDAESLVRQLQAEAAGVARQLELLGAKDGKPELALVTPIDGIIVEAHATLGEMTRVDEPPFVVSDPSEVWVIGLVPELKVREVAVGKTVRLRLGAYPGEHWEGPIAFVSPSLDEDARALPIRVPLPNPDGRLRAGLFGTLEILSGGAGEAPVAAIPVTALVTLEGRDAVFVPGDQPGSFRSQFVTLGRREDGLVEIVEGLAPGAALVVSGAFTLKSVREKGALAEHDH